MSFDDTVTIVVGPEKRRFIAPKNVLCQHSLFFKAAFSGNWAESSPGSCLEMPEDDSDAFTTYLHWTVTGEVVYDHEIASDADTLLQESVDLYILADKVCDKQLQNTVIDHLDSLFEGLEWLPTEVETFRPMGRLPEHCMLYKYLVDQFAFTATMVYKVDLVAAYPAFFAKVLSVTSSQRKRDGVKWEPATCDYHLDDADNPECE